MDTSKNTGKDTITIDSAKAEVLAALSQKYEKTFECVAYEKPSLINGEYTFCLVETGFEYEGYGFKAYYNPNSEMKISDGYFGVLVRDELSQLVLSKMSSSDEMKVFSELSQTAFDNKLGGKSTLTDAASIYDSMRVYYYVFFSEESKSDIKTLESGLGNSFVTGKISYYVIPKDVYSDLSYETYNDIVGSIASGDIKVENKGIIEF